MFVLMCDCLGHARNSAPKVQNAIVAAKLVAPFVTFTGGLVGGRTLLSSASPP